jgi:hypothetical protein
MADVIEDEQVVTCIVCEEKFDADDGEYTFTTDGDIICHGCEESEFSHASTVVLLDPESPQSEPKRVLVTEHFIVESEYLEPFSDLTIKRDWLSSSGWRGHYETTIEDWTEVLDGWTTGWVDETVSRKQRFNDWVQGLADDPDAQAMLPCKVAIIFDPTSNVFSMGIGVHVPEAKRDAFVEWLNGDFDVLHDALT